MWLVAPSDISSNFREQNISKDTEGTKHLRSKKNLESRDIS